MDRLSFSAASFIVADVVSPAALKDANGANDKHAPVATSGTLSALVRARYYLLHCNFSRASLIEQLVHEGFSGREARRAVDLADPDWSLEALGAAEAYLDAASSSATELLEHLVSEGFTSEQIDFALTLVSADWDVNAALAACEHLCSESLTVEELMQRLIDDGFTPAQARHGVAGVGK